MKTGIGAKWRPGFHMGREQGQWLNPEWISDAVPLLDEPGEKGGNFDVAVAGHLMPGISRRRRRDSIIQPF